MCAETVCLAIRLEGPLQAWGSASQYNRRLTDLLPSRSAVTGMLCAALGLGRGSTEETDFLREMTGVRMLAVAVPRRMGGRRSLCVAWRIIIPCRIRPKRMAVSRIVISPGGSICWMPPSGSSSAAVGRCWKRPEQPCRIRFGACGWGASPASPQPLFSQGSLLMNRQLSRPVSRKVWTGACAPGMRFPLLRVRTAWQTCR